MNEQIPSRVIKKRLLCMMCEMKSNTITSTKYKVTLRPPVIPGISKRLK
jgi:hypothetical protein